MPGLSFDRVDTPAYPLFREPQYLLALTNAIVRISRDHRLDIVHAHYAVPHATAAYLARQILTAEHVATPPRMLTTLHGTDITLVGSDPSYARVVAFSIEQSDGVTAVSRSLRSATGDTLGLSCPIRVIPNFLDCETYRRPPRPDVERRVVDSGLQQVVEFAGEQHDLVPWLSAADLFLLPSQQESFGLAALEAMACEVPVVASRVGGLPEIIDDGRIGYLREPDDIDGMAERGIALLADAELRGRIGRAAAAHVRERFCAELIVPQYEQCYRDLLASR